MPVAVPGHDTALAAALNVIEAQGMTEFVIDYGIHEVAAIWAHVDNALGNRQHVVVGIVSTIDVGW
jgi:hypothetical protein